MADAPFANTRKKGIDFQVSDPPRAITDPIGFAKTGTTRAYEAYPCHLYITPQVKRADRPLKFSDGYTFVVAHDETEKKHYLSLGYAERHTEVKDTD
jgi:hypothetical protein